MSSTERLEIVGLTHNIAGGGQGHGQPERELGADQCRPQHTGPQH